MLSQAPHFLLGEQVVKKAEKLYKTIKFYIYSSSKTFLKFNNTHTHTRNTSENFTSSENIT